MTVNEKVAIVTGGAGGIGRGIAERLASLGVQVIITSRSAERAQKVAAEITEQHGPAGFGCYELENKESAKELLEAVYDRHNRIDILVNNAVSHPTLPPIPIEKLDYDLMQSGITANLTNLLYLSSLAHDYLKETKGSLLNIGSAVTRRSMSGVPLYGILKGAMSQMTKSLAAEWAKDGIKVNQINPGLVESEAYKSIGIPPEAFSAMIQHYLQFHPIGRIGMPKDIGALAGHLLADDVSWMTGAIIEMDGGYSVQGVPAPFEMP